MKEITPELKKLLLKYQVGEINGAVVYSRMADRAKNEDDRKILNEIAADEKEHAAIWAKYTGREIKPNGLIIFWYTLIGYIMGYTFLIKLMEKGEERSEQEYRNIIDEIPEVESILKQEEAHEDKLMAMLDEERLKYVGAIVLGLNDALVELTGSIAGFTFALGNTRLIALTGIITGVAATLSMAASNYLAENTEGNPNALKASLYTGTAYLVTVIFLVTPYLLYPQDMYIAALATMLTIVILIIFFFNYYVSVAKSLNFWKRFGQMAIVSLGVALISFLIGLAAKALLGVDI